MSHCLPSPPPKPAAPTVQIAASSKQTQLITGPSLAVGTSCFSRTAVLIFIEPNSNGEPLHYFHVIPGCIFRRKEAKKRTSGTGKALHFAVVGPPEGVNSHRD